MSMKPNYFKIGVFVIIAFVLIIAAVVVFGSGLFAGETIYFETYFDDSVSGLNIGAPMENRGVRIGRVEKITFTRNEYEVPIGSEDYFKYGNYVMVLVAVDKENLPEIEMTQKQKKEYVKQITSRGFRVRLATNLLTGQAYLQGSYLDPNRYPVLEVPWEPHNFYVSSAPGEFTTMKQSVDKILRKLEQIDTKRISDVAEELIVSVNRAVNDANISGISNGIQDLFADADQAIADVNVQAISNELQNLLAEARQTNQHLQELIKKPDKTTSQMANIALMVANLNKALLRIDRLLSSQTPQIEQTLENLTEVSADLKELIGSLKQNPSQLIFSEPPSRSEVSK